MIVKVFQKNKNGKIELTKEELETLLNEVYWDGYNAHNTWVYKSPSVTQPYPIFTTTTMDKSCFVTNYNTDTTTVKN